VTYLPVGVGSTATDINGIGHVVGSRKVAGGYLAGFFWNGSLARTLRAPNELNPQAVAVNADDVIVGNSEFQYGRYDAHALLWSSPGELPSTLPRLSEWPVAAADINDAGVVVGSETSYATGYPQSRAVIWR